MIPGNTIKSIKEYQLTGTDSEKKINKGCWLNVGFPLYYMYHPDASATTLIHIRTSGGIVSGCILRKKVTRVWASFPGVTREVGDR